MAETITAAVGTPPALNHFSDVETVQSLLNQVPDTEGGPSPLLDVDGMIGPLTIAAIRRFQQRQFGWNDGRVDTNKVTIARLNDFDLDPAPGNPVKFQEFEPNFGFDPPNPVRGSAPWQMVPLGGSKIVLVVGGGGVRQVTSNNLGIARPLFLGGAVQIFGVARGTAIIKLRDANGRVLARLDVSVKRKRTMRTSFFFVQDNNRRTTRTAADVDPVLQGMNDIWLPQANVEFVRKLVKDPEPYDDDFGAEVLDPSALPARNRPRDEWAAIVSHRDRGADFNVFFVWDVEQDLDTTTDGIEASTGPPEKSCVVDEATNTAIGTIVAHEAGHGMGLPDTGNPPELMFRAPALTKIPRAHVDR